MEVILGSLPDGSVKADGFDYILANISANVLKMLSTELLNAVKQDGSVISSGVLLDRYDEVEQAFNEVGGKLVDKRVSGDWICFKVQRA